MGLAPIAAGVSLVSGIASYAQQQSAASAQAQAISENKKAARAQAAINQAQVETRRQFAQQQSLIGAMQRELGNVQFDAGLKLSAIMDAIQLQQQAYEAQAAKTLADINRQDIEAQAQKLRMQLQADKAQRKGAALTKDIQFNAALIGQLEELQRAIAQGDQQLAAQLAASVAAGLSSQGLSDEVLREKGAMELSRQGSSGVLMSDRLSEQSLRQLMHEMSVADLLEQIGGVSVDQMLRQGDIRSQMAQTLLDSALEQIDIERGAKEAGRRTARQQFEVAKGMDVHTQRLNEIFAESGYQQQSAAVQSALGAQLNQLEAQKAQIQRPSIFSLLQPMTQFGASFINTTPSTPAPTNPLFQNPGNNVDLRANVVTPGMVKQTFGSPFAFPGLL